MTLASYYTCERLVRDGGFEMSRMATAGQVSMIFLLLLGCEIDTEDYYQNLSEAANAGVLEKRWFPDFIPQSATESHVRFDLDLQEGWVRFKFETADMKAAIANLSQLTPSEIDEVKFRYPRTSDWWPKDLDRKSFDGKKRRDSPLEIYRYHRILTYADRHKESIPCYLVIDWESNLAYFWSLGEVYWVRLPDSTQ